MVTGVLLQNIKALIICEFLRDFKVYCLKYLFIYLLIRRSERR